MRINFGQYNQPYYEYGSQKSKNHNYKKPEKSLTGQIAIATLGVGCLATAILHKTKRF